MMNYKNPKIKLLKYLIIASYLNKYIKSIYSTYSLNGKSDITEVPEENEELDDDWDETDEEWESDDDEWSDESQN